jgi:hypothetical protein
MRSTVMLQFVARIPTLFQPITMHDGKFRATNAQQRHAARDGDEVMGWLEDLVKEVPLSAVLKERIALADKNMRLPFGRLRISKKGSPL